MDDRNTVTREGNQPSRAPYEPPAIEESATFERLQLSCGFIAAETFECETQPGS